MKSTSFLAIASGLLILASTSCIDDKYDLSDIDTTVQVKIDRLVVPINIDQISLSSVIDETENIKVINGEYAYVTDGTFESDPISIDPFEVTIGQIDDSEVIIAQAPEFRAPSALPAIPEIDVVYNIAQSSLSDFSFTSENISDNLMDLTTVDGHIKMTVDFNLQGLKQYTSHVNFNDVVIRLPKNLPIATTSSGTYDPSTGDFKINNQTIDTDKSFSLQLELAGLDIEKGDFNPNDHTITIHGKLGIVDGTFSFSPDFLLTESFPESLGFSIGYEIEDFVVNSFTGDLQYDIDNLDIPEVSLTDIPNFLDQKGTNLILANPQLYLRANNPLNMYEGIYAETGIEIIASRDNTSGSGLLQQTYTIDQPFKIGGKQHIDEFDYVLAPSMPETVDPAYPNPTFVKFSSLGNVLSGDGLPKALKVTMVDPMVPTQRVNNFQLGHSYSPIKGTWKFIAPFNLSTGSYIIYSDVVDGWSSEDLDKATITYLEVTANVSTDIPVSVEFIGNPIDKAGNPIPGTRITGATIDPMAKNQPVTITVKMPENGIRNLDGLKFEAVANAVDGPALSPDMKIDVTNIRPCISGYYETEF